MARAETLRHAEAPSRTETLLGTLTRESISIGGEDNGYRLHTKAIDVDLNNLAHGSTLMGERVRVDGVLYDKLWPLRQTVMVLRGLFVQKESGAVMPTMLHGDVLFVGTLAGSIIRLGGETTGYELRDIEVEIDSADASAAAMHINKVVRTVGWFIRKDFIERGIVWAFHATEIYDLTQTLTMASV